MNDRDEGRVKPAIAEQVTTTERRSMAMSEEEKTMYRRFMTSRSGQQDFSAYSRQLEAKAEIERF